MLHIRAGYLVIAKYLSIGSIFFFISIKKKMDLMDPMDKYLVIAKYIAFFLYNYNTYPMYPSDPFFFIELNTYPMYPSDPFFFISKFFYKCLYPRPFM
jgi:hypothetical protein